MQRQQRRASIPLLCLLLLAGAAAAAAAAVAPGGDIVGTAAVDAADFGVGRQLLVEEGQDEEWDVEAEEEDEAVVAEELAPPCAGMPTFVWGGKGGYLGGQGVYETRSLTHVEAARALTAAAAKGGKAGAAEVAVVLVAPHSVHAYRNELAARFPGLRAMVAEMPSSKVISCVTRASAAPVAEAYTTARTTGVEPSELVAFLTSAPDMMSNGALDVVVSTLPESMGPEAVDKLLGEVSAALKTALPDGRFLLVLTAEFAPGHPIAAPRAQHRRRILQGEAPVDDGYYPKQYLYATPTLVAGLLSGALLIAIAYLGASVLLSLQGPKAWIHQPIPAGKEY